MMLLFVCLRRDSRIVPVVSFLFMYFVPAILLRVVVDLSFMSRGLCLYLAFCSCIPYPQLCLSMSLIFPSGLSFVRVMSKHMSFARLPTFAVFRFVRSCHPVALRSLQDNRTPRNINDTVMIAGRPRKQTALNSRQRSCVYYKFERSAQVKMNARQ